MPSALDVYVLVHVDLVQVVGRDGPSPIPEQLRERDVIARPESPNAFLQWLVPARGWVWWWVRVPAKEQCAILLLCQNPSDVSVTARPLIIVEPAVIV